jgi:heme-degrading monooxygenase HmoA
MRAPSLFGFGENADEDEGGTMKLRTLFAVALLAVLLTPLTAASAEKRSIARIWKGRTLAAKASEYEAYLLANGVTKIRATPGNQGVRVLSRAEGDRTEFVVISFWESLDAVKKFAGEDYQKAVILPKDREYLIEVEPNVVHYQVVPEERKP